MISFLLFAHFALVQLHGHQRATQILSVTYTETRDTNYLPLKNIANTFPCENAYVISFHNTYKAQNYTHKQYWSSYFIQSISALAQDLLSLTNFIIVIIIIISLHRECIMTQQQYLICFSVMVKYAHIHVVAAENERCASRLGLTAEVSLGS